jgi:hypothetical protein
MTNKTKWATALLVMVAFLSSCQTNDPVNQTVEPYTFSKDYKVNYKEWQQGNDDESGMYYYKIIHRPDLTQDNFDNGTMQAFLMYSDGALSPLPFNDYWMSTDDAGQLFYFTEQITCEFLPGQIKFIVKASDHNPDFLPHYDDYNFNVRFMW